MSTRSAGYYSGEGLIRFEGVLTETLGFAGLGGDPPARAMMQPWRRRDGELVESVLGPVEVTNRNPDWAWSAGEFLSCLMINGEIRPVTQSGYNWLMHAEHDGAAFVPKANRWGNYSISGSVRPRFEPDYTDIADFSSSDGSATLEKFTVNAYANNTITELSHSFSAGHIETGIQFTGTNATFSQASANIYSLLWITGATYDPAVDGAIGFLRVSAARANDVSYISEGAYGWLTFIPAYGVCCRQGGKTYVSHGSEVSAANYAFPSEQLTPMPTLSADDFAEITPTAYDSTSHPDFTAGGDEIAWGFFAAPGSYRRSPLSNVGTVSFAADWGLVSMSLDFSRFAIAIAPG